MKGSHYLLAVLAVILAATAVMFILVNSSSVPSNLPPDVEPPSDSGPIVITLPAPAPVPAESPKPSSQPVKEPVAKPQGQGRQRAPGEPLRIPAGQPIPEIFPHEKERGEIQRLAATYDAKRIPELAAYLEHSDAMVRDEARLGLIQLSSPEAVPVLRAAAAKAKNSEEAAALREAADFLSPAGSG